MGDKKMEWKKDPGGTFEDDGAATWSPTEADELVGVLTEKKTVETKRGPVTLLKIQDEDGNLFQVWCNRASLKNIVEEYDEDLIVGRTVGLRTEGEKKIDGNKTFFPYEIGFGDELVGATSNRAASTNSNEPF